ncbi:MAG: L,D-transpeptidase, partial [Actinobacteria bacterium]|nr:L,D-transpeptidase [Actinomycetota bacterium]
MATVHGYRPLTGERTVLPLLENYRAPDGQLWLEVRLPGRPLRGPPPPETGWILASQVTYRGTVWHIVIRTAAHQALIYNEGRVIRAFSVINGKSSTPTPLGEFFVEENVELGPGDVGAPFALTTSARSAVLQEFDGGPGQIALHGLRNIGGRLGTAASHGCV